MAWSRTASRSSRDLHTKLELILSTSSAERLETVQQLLHYSKHDFVNLLRYKGPNAESREQILTKRPFTPEGQIVLDDEPDVREVQLLAEEMKLDEILALLCILAVKEECGEVMAAAAAGVYLEERQALLSSLKLLLETQVFTSFNLSEEVSCFVSNYVNELLHLQQGDKTLLLHRIIELIQDDTLFAGSTSKLPQVIDTRGRVLDRNVMMLREHTLLCECLIYCVQIKQRLTKFDVIALIDLVQHLAHKSQGSSFPDIDVRHQTNLALLALLSSFVPNDIAEQDEECRQLELGDLARDSTISSKASSLDASEPYSASVKFGWGVLLANFGDETSRRGEAANFIQAAVRAGVLEFFVSNIIDSEAMQDDTDYQRELYASILNQQLMNFLCSTVGRDNVVRMCNESALQAASEVIGGGVHSTPPNSVETGALVVKKGTSGAKAALAATADNLSSILKLLGGILRMNPQLFLDPALRYDTLGEFMGFVAEHEAIHSPTVFVCYLDVLSVLATGEDGARSMYQQLRPGNSVEMLSWSRMFKVLMKVIQEYLPPDPDQHDKTLGASNTAVGVQQRPLDLVMPSCDAMGMCAFLRLFSRIMSQCHPDEAVIWIQQLEEEAGVTPVWEIFFQLMCCPVPQDLKASLDFAIASLARRPDVCALLLDRLLAAVIVQPDVVGQTGGVKYDISYQLNEIQARGEEYGEIIAFVSLLNAVWNGLNGSLPDDGIPVSHLTKFVKNEVLGTVFQRSYKNEGQCWELAAVCLDHCRYCLTSLDIEKAVAYFSTSSSTSTSPGIEVLVDILGERGAMRTAMRVLLTPIEQLAYERHAAPYGKAKEEAALAALRLLSAVFEVDTGFVAAIRRVTHTATYESLDGVFRHDRSRIPALLDYVRYPHNPALQFYALKLTAVLVERLPDLVHLLPDDACLIDGFAECLHNALFSTIGWVPEDGKNNSEHWGAGNGCDAVDKDPRATLMLEMLLGALDHPVPTLTHVLAGFSFDTGMNLLGPSPSQYNILRVVFEAIESSRLQATQPLFLEQCMELVHQLAAAQDTGPSMLELLRMRWFTGLEFVLDGIAMGTLQQDAQPCIATLNQMAWLLKIISLELHHADMAISQHASSVKHLLEVLLGTAETIDNEKGLPIGQSRMQQLLDIVLHCDGVEKPLLGKNSHPDVRRMLQSLGADSLYGGKAGTAVVSHRGYVIYDLRSVKSALLERYNDWVSHHGPPNDVLKEACRLCLVFAEESNIFIDQLAAQTSLLDAWCSLMTIAFSRRFNELIPACGSSSAFELCFDALENCLMAIIRLLEEGRENLAVPLCQLLLVLMACLQERLAANSSAQLLQLVPPRRCLELMHALFIAAWEGRRTDGIRVSIFTVLSTQLAMMRATDSPDGPPAVIELLLRQGKTFDPISSSEAAVLQAELESGTVASLAANRRVLALLVADAQSHNSQQAAVALSTLISMVGSDTSGIVAQELFSQGLPAHILSQLSSTSANITFERYPGSGGQIQVLQLQLTLLNRLCLASPGHLDGPGNLFLAQALPQLSVFQVMDIQVEDPHAYGLPGVASQRRRLGDILTLVLRLVLGIVQSLNTAATTQALHFMEAHSMTWVRIMHDACHPGTREWSPGPQELELCELTVQVLCAVLPDAVSCHIWPQLHEAFSRVAARYLWPSTGVSQLLLQNASSSAAADTMDLNGTETPGCEANVQWHNRVLGLRCALAYCVYKGWPAASLFPYPAHSSSSRPLACITRAILQAVSNDLPYLLENSAAKHDHSREGVVRSGPVSEASKELLQGVLVYRTAYLCEVLVSILLEIVRSQHEEMQQDQEGNSIRDVISSVEQVLQRENILLKYSTSLPLLLRRTSSLLIQ